MILDLPAGTALYHGSYTIVETPDLSLCEKGKDFGKGFYLTTDIEQARNFVPLSVRKAIQTGRISKNTREGFVSKYAVKSVHPNLNGFKFASADEAWLKYVSFHRTDPSGKELLLPTMEIVPANYDVIAGKVADDDTNTTITAYLSGVYGKITDPSVAPLVVSRLKPEVLTDQYCLLTDKALSAIEFEGYERYGF